MRIGVDIRVLARGKTTGIQVYTRELLSRLFKVGEDHDFLLFYNAYRRVPLPRAWRRHPRVEIVASHVPNKVFDMVTAVVGRPRVDRMLGGVDCFFQPHFLRAPLSPGCPRVIVAHDCSFEYDSRWFSLRSRLWHARMNPRRRFQEADHVIAVSEATKRDLVRMYDLPTKRITTISSGVDHAVFSHDEEGHNDITDALTLPQSFFLLFSARDPRKNSVGAIHAYEEFYRKSTASNDSSFVARGLEMESRFGERHDAIPHLVIAGAEGAAAGEIESSIASSSLKQYIHQIGRIPERFKPSLLRRAFCLLFPSFFEGFGFPPLEAAFVGTPVIAGDRGALPEVLEDSALLVDPWDGEGLSDAMVELWSDQNLYSALQRSGKDRAEQFSWNRAAHGTLAVLREVVKA